MAVVTGVASAFLSAGPSLSVSPSSLDGRLTAGHVAAEEVEGSNEAVIAELGVLGLHGRVLEPVERLDVAAVDEARVLDLEAGRQAVDEQDAAAGVRRLDLDHHDQAIVLLQRGRAAGGARRGRPSCRRACSRCARW